MNLPNLHQLQNDQSTYIQFSKALLDFDKAISNNEVCYFSRMVCLNLPNWESNTFFNDLSNLEISVGDEPDVSIPNSNPNIAMPKLIQYYMENIIRQSIGKNDEIIDKVTEIAFWKTLSVLGLSDADIRNTVTFANQIVISNFVDTENNNGWAEIVTQIPNKCKLLTPAWKTLDNVADLVQCTNDDTSMFDNGYKQFIFSDDQKKVLDFDNFVFDDVTESSFDFNTILLFYVDASGVEKLHGINFIYPFENKLTYWDIEKFTQKTNKIATIGYQYKFNMKSCNNEATKLYVYELQEHMALQQFSKTLTRLDNFLELKMREGDIVSE